MAKTPKRAKAKKRKPQRKKPDPANRRPTKDEQIAGLEKAQVAALEARDLARQDFAQMSTARDKLKAERDGLLNELSDARAILRRLRDEASRQLGYIQRVQEDNMASGSWRQTGQTTTSTGIPGSEHVTYNAEPARSPVHFAPISEVVMKPRSHGDTMRDAMQSGSGMSWSGGSGGGAGGYQR